MEQVYSLVITKVPGGANPVISHGTETVAELFATAFNGESINGYQITVGGQAREASYIPRQGENITVAKMIKVTNPLTTLLKINRRKVTFFLLIFILSK